MLFDTLGRPFAAQQRPLRVVSLVPSDTFTVVALGAKDRLVGRTDWCIHPEKDLAHVPRIGGTKTPRVADILALKPDLVIANKEENKKKHFDAIEAAGIAVFVSQPATVEASSTHVLDLGRLLHCDAAAQGLVDKVLGLPALPARPLRTLYFIWYNPYMTVAHDTYPWDALTAVGFAPWAPVGSSRYPRLDRHQIEASGAEVVMFPSEPFEFKQAHVDEFARAFPNLPAVRTGRLVQVAGEHATWHGAWACEGLPALAALREKLMEAG